VEHLILAIAWLVGSLHPAGPYGILAVGGEQGAAKTSLCCYLRDLIDPNVAPLRAEPKELHDLILAASNSWVVGFDNVSHLSPTLADSLCRISTGSGFGTRTLYSDDEETLFQGKRPVLLNGIETLTTRDDLADRAFVLTLPPIDAASRRSERELRAAFMAARGRLFGALLTAVSQALKDVEQIRLPELPRMADQCEWVVAAEPVLPWKTGEFLRVATQNRAEVHAVTLENAAIYSPLEAVLAAHSGRWEGSATALLALLNEQATDTARRGRKWPGSPAALSGQLRRLAPALRGVGITLERDRQGHQGDRKLIVRQEAKKEPPNPPDKPGEKATEKSVSAVSFVSRVPEHPKSADDPAVPADDSGSHADDPEDESRAPDADTNADEADEAGISADDHETRAGTRFCARADAADAADASSPPHQIVENGAQLLEVAAALSGVDQIGLDTETTGLNPRRDRLRLLSLSTPDHGYLIDCFRVDIRPLFPVLAAATLVGHNVSFDLQFLAQLGFSPGAVQDTLLMSRVLHAGEYEAEDPEDTPESSLPHTGTVMRHRLADVALRELGVALPKELQKSGWSGELSIEQCEYAARDAQILLPLVRVLEERLAVASLTAVADLEHRVLPAMVWMGAAGVGLDADAWQQLIADNEAELRQCEAELTALAPPPPVPVKGRASRWNWRSPTQVRRILALLEVQVESTREEILERVRHPIAALLLRYRSLQKRLSTYGANMLTHSEAGRIYAGWSQIGAAPGRMSCSKPNLQNIPRERRYRVCFTAPPGRILIKADYSQIELRIAAKVAGDERMLAAYQNGEDLHTLTAQQLSGKAEVSKAVRQIAKAVNFGLLYGMGAEGLQRYAASQYRVTMTLDEARRYRQAFFTAYPGLARWHLQVKAEHADETRTLLGRRRRLTSRTPDTQRLNSPIQGTGADGLKAALALLYERRHVCPSAVPILACHDEILLEVDDDQAEAAAIWLRKAMEDGMQPFLTPIPAVVELQIGPTWAG
jgi:DNA polymerase-1